MARNGDELWWFSCLAFDFLRFKRIFKHKYIDKITFSKVHIIIFKYNAAIMLCCCFRFRIPRTKQEIEADFQRRKIAKKFRDRLANIRNSEMDDMDLQKGY